MKKIQVLAILACTASLFAQEAATPAAVAPATVAPAPAAVAATPAPVAATPAPVAPPAPAPVVEEPKFQFACEADFEKVKKSTTAKDRDVSSNRINAMVNSRVVALKGIKTEDRKGAIFEAEVKNCGLAVEVLKTQLSNVALRKSLDSLIHNTLVTEREISVIKDSLISLWTSDAKGAKSLNAVLTEERNRLEKLKETVTRDSIEKARLVEELAKKEKAIAERDSLIAAQKAEAEKKLESLASKTISVYKDARGTILSMSDILFETAKADLKPELKENLAAIAAILQSLLSESSVIVEGHTDNVGSAQLNNFLSEQRANAVQNYLVERGVDRARLKAVGFGFSRPVADNGTEEGRAKNRRVELIIQD